MKHRSPHIHFPAGGKRLRVCLLALCDIACVSGIFLLTGYVHSRWAGSVCDFGAVCRETLPFLFLFLIYNALFRVYHGSFFYPGICLNKIEEIRRISLSVFNVYFLLFICRFFSGQREHLPWSVLFFSMGFTILLLPVCRFLVRFLMQQLNFGLIDVVIAGAGKTGEIVSRDALMTRLWESDSFVDENTLTVNVNRLRRKLAGVGLVEFIATRHGVGYIVE